MLAQKGYAFFKVFILILIIAFLSSCAEYQRSLLTGKKAGSVAATPLHKFPEQRDSQNRVINSLSAPSNQTYYFDFDSSAIREEDRKAIAVQANYLVRHRNASVRLEGHTDARGSREYNIGLGWRRDQAVANMLKQHGVSAKQIHMMSYGKERPVALGNNEAAFLLNRRVQLFYEGY